MLNHALIVGNKGAEVAIIALAFAKGNVYVKPEGLAVFLSEHKFTPVLIILQNEVLQVAVSCHLRA
jgi:hypothetical protein